MSKWYIVFDALKTQGRALRPVSTTLPEHVFPNQIVKTVVDEELLIAKEKELTIAIAQLNKFDEFLNKQGKTIKEFLGEDDVQKTTNTDAATGTGIEN